MRSAVFFVLLILALAGAVFLLDVLRKVMRPKESVGRGLLYLLLTMLFIVLYTGAIVWATRLIFGKP